MGLQVNIISIKRMRREKGDIREPTIEISPKPEHDKNPKLARRNFYLREASHFVCNGSSVKRVEFELSVY